ncbi:UNVERIFIED_CONTAM: hypothetical protein Sradi_3416800 [Sesamum radiatum]|uniref:SWIM-type domain-containing protein n=1 Tax=Sesamum radiatum TaxID=300843 RepID=A0AAW2R5S3_SESRA
MGWRLRREDDEILPGRQAPDYGPNSDYFTIRMHYDGQMCELGRRVYVGGKIAHFDYCEVDEMSLLELYEMAKELHINTEVVTFFYSRDGINDCNSINMISTDSHTLELINFVDENRVIGIFLDHGHELERSQSESSSRDHDSEVAVNEESEEGVRAEVSQGVEDEGIRTKVSQGVSEENVRAEVSQGVGNEGITAEVSQGVENVVIRAEVSQGVENVQDLGEGMKGDENVQILGGIQDDRNSTESSDEQSVGDDSCYSDVLVDSEIGSGDEVSDWGVEVNWGGLQRKGKISNVKKSSKGKEVVQHSGFSVFNLNLDNDDPQFEVGLCFPDTQTFRDAVRQHSIVNARDVVFTKNDKNKVQVKCKHESCPWYIFASQIHGEDTMQVKTLKSVHECTRVERVSAANSKWLANKYKDKIRTDPNWPVDSMMSVMQKECKLMFSKFQMYRAKGKVAKMAAGSEDQQYGMLWRYAAEIVRSNPNTTVKIKTTEVEGNLHFKRFYCCWGALKSGLLDGCRPLICLDGCHLKTVCGGILLCAVGIDANNCMYPFAYAVVEKEKKSTWDRDKEAFKWLAKRPAAQWSRACFRTHSKCDILLNNLCESFNATLVAARSKPIVDMLETIRMMLMKRIYVKRDQMKKHKGILCPNIQKMMEELKKKSMEYIAHWNGHDQFELEGCYGDRHTLNLSEQTCSCRKWQLTGIPCAHAIAGMFFMGYKPEDYVDECYKKTVFLKTYSHLMMPLHGPEEWPQSDKKPLLPPVIERMPGRPKKQDRQKAPQELEELKQKSKMKKVEVTNCGEKIGKLGRQGLKMTCKICGVPGHNSRTCPQNPKQKQQEQNVELQGIQISSQKSVTGPLSPNKERKKMVIRSKAKKKDTKKDSQVPPIAPSKYDQVPSPSSAAGPSTVLASQTMSNITTNPVHKENSAQ